MRELNIGTKQHTKVIAINDPGPGGACHNYSIVKTDAEDPLFRNFAHINFQKGLIKENGVNGCHHEDLIAIVIDRLKSFQRGAFACRENAKALTKLEEALHWLRHRTDDRINRGGEGTLKF